jgi:hypothetical protein
VMSSCSRWRRARDVCCPFPCFPYGLEAFAAISVFPYALKAVFWIRIRWNRNHLASCFRIR